MSFSAGSWRIRFKDIKKAEKLVAVKAVCGVGMSGGDSQLADMKKTNHIPDSMPVFYLQGGLELDKLHGIYKLMMKTMKSTVEKGLSGKKGLFKSIKERYNLSGAGRHEIALPL